MDINWRESFDNTSKKIEDGEKLYEQLLSVRDEGTDILVCPEHMGDTLWVAAMAGAYIKAHECNRVYYAVKESQKDLVNQFPDIDGTIVLNNYEMSCLEQYIIVMQYWNHEHIVYAHFPAYYVYNYPSFSKAQYSVLPPESTMLETRKHMLGLNGDITLSRMLPLDDGNNQELKALFGNAVLLMPVSQSMEGIPTSLWEQIAKTYISLGYNVYTNYNNFDYEILIDKTQPLASTIMELAEIGPYFAQVIGLRSGACDLLAETDTNLAILYGTRSQERKVELSRNELGIENIFDLIDRQEIYNYQYIEGMNDELVKALVSRVRRSSDSAVCNTEKIIDVEGSKKYDSVDNNKCSGNENTIDKEVISEVNDSLDIRMLLDSVKAIVSRQKQTEDTIEEIIDNQNKLQQVISQISVNQYAMDHSIENIKYEVADQIINSERNRFVFPKFETLDETIEKLIQGKSMSRFGDGEFAIMSGTTRHEFQKYDKKLSERLKEVLQSKNDNVLIGIANMYGDLSQYSQEGRYNIRAYMSEEVRRQHYALLDMERVYSDAYVSRPYSGYADNMTEAPRLRFEQLKKIWDDKNLLLIEGEKTRMGIGNDLFDNAKDITRILGPAENAFDRYDEILECAKNNAEGRLVLIAMSATATVLAYDLALLGFQAIDIGHVDLEYEWMKAGTGGKVETRYKYNNELPGGELVEELHDELYESQIIARIL